tara:strand:- start:874 stop:1059 length:186 start_codon:yes stop_codon:yes gene_type:complete
MAKCVVSIQHSMRNVGKTYKSRCGKESKFIDEHGRDLCEKHFKKWYKKRFREEYNTEFDKL